MPREAVEHLEKAKEILYDSIIAKEDDPVQHPWPSMLKQMEALRVAVHELVEELLQLDLSRKEAMPCGHGAEPVEPNVTHTNTLDGTRVRHCVTSRPKLAVKRWVKLKEDFWDKKAKEWNISKIPEIYDAVKYDVM